MPMLPHMDGATGREPGFGGWVRYIWAEGLARKFIVEREGRDHVRLPLTIVVVAALFAPWLAALGVVIAVLTGSRVSIERDAAPEAEAPAEPELLADIPEPPATPGDAAP